ncbi:hypothetical protein D1007_56770 [Hordeum vulgare]|nr:hypothetical protein D1007_56770 [Hordeum vulgare]
MTAQPPHRNQSPACRPLLNNRSRAFLLGVRGGRPFCPAYGPALNNTAHALEVEGSDTVGSVKEEGVPPQQQLLFFGDQGLEDARTLADHGIVDGASVCLIAINMQG